MEAEKILKKLRLDKAANALIVNAPDEFTTMLKDIDHDTKPSKKKEGQYDFVMIFATHRLNWKDQLKRLQMRENMIVCSGRLTRK